MTDTSQTIFAGMSTAQLTAALSVAQQAYLDLSTGQKVVQASYMQGDGSRSVTYTQTDTAKLAMLIKSLQVQLGLVTRSRRPIGFRFR